MPTYAFTVAKAGLNQQVDKSIMNILTDIVTCRLSIGFGSGVVILSLQNKVYGDKSNHRWGNSEALSNDQSKKSCFDQNGRFIG
jgi:hypothetical protein